MWKTLFFLVVIGLITTVVCQPAVTQETPSLLVDLDARDASAGTATWKTRTGTGDFQRVAAPRVATVEGVRAGLTATATKSAGPFGPGWTGAAMTFWAAEMMAPRASRRTLSQQLNFLSVTKYGRDCQGSQEMQIAMVFLQF